MKQFLYSFILALCAVFSLRASQCSDLVIFSFNRPLQLYALLESLGRYCRGMNEVHVIYRSSHEQFDQGYAIVQNDFPGLYYHKQGSNPQQDFKQLTIQAVFESSSPYILFAVDDIVVKKEVDLSVCIEALEKYGAYGFFLRLGTHLTNCYSYSSRPQPLPPLKQEQPGIFSWHFNFGIFDFNYPHCVDMTLYRKKDIETALRNYTYHAPNKLEEIWNRHASTVINKKGLCYDFAPIVNLPLNRVQYEYHNRAMQEWSAQDLLQKFLAGYKMDIAPLYGACNTAAHMEYSPTFIMR